MQDCSAQLSRNCATPTSYINVGGGLQALLDTRDRPARVGAVVAGLSDRVFHLERIANLAGSVCK